MSNLFKSQTFRSDRENKPQPTDPKVIELLEIFEKLDDEGKRDVLRYARQKLQEQRIDEICRHELNRRLSN